MSAEENTRLLKSIAAELGFTFCGVSRAEFLESEARKLDEWLHRGYAGAMGYLDRNTDKRLDPRLLVPGAKTVVSLMYNYYPREPLTTGPYSISKYAYGEDYHRVIKDLLHDLVARLQAKVGDIQGRVFVDSAPVMERAWAARSGLGWIGKNSLLLNKQQGSFFFLAELISDLDLEPDGPVKDHCGSCTACMDACPTGAIPEPYVVNGSACISYFTIELSDELPSAMKGKFGNWIFGCDICQDVCPWNRFSKPHTESRFEPGEGVRQMKDSDWEELTESVFNRVFADSPMQRAGYDGLRRNIRFIGEGSPTTKRSSD
jgi:epoxyqueuosine reductase